MVGLVDSPSGEVLTFSSLPRLCGLQLLEAEDEGVRSETEEARPRISSPGVMDLRWRGLCKYSTSFRYNLTRLYPHLICVPVQFV